LRNKFETLNISTPDLKGSVGLVSAVSNYIEFGGLELIRDHRKYIAKTKALAIAFKARINDDDRLDVW
jgi:hypothetical protein